MARAKTKSAEASDTAVAEAPEKDIFDEQKELRDKEAADRQRERADTIIHGVGESTRMPEDNGHAVQHAPHNGHAAAVQKKKYTPPADPFGVEGIKAGDNRVHLAKSDTDSAWIIRFDKNPNQGEYSKENPHPVLAYLKSEGYRWGFSDADGKGGWGKLMQEGHYTYSEHMDAQRVTRAAAEMLGPVQDRGRIPD